MSEVAHNWNVGYFAAALVLDVLCVVFGESTGTRVLYAIGALIALAMLAVNQGWAFN